MKNICILLLMIIWTSQVIAQTLAPSPTENFVRVESLLVPGRTSDDLVLSATDDQKTVEYQYADGLGRTTQTVIWRGSPEKRDLIFPVVSAIGSLQPIEYLPYRSTATNGGFRTSPFTEQSSFYVSPSIGITANSRPLKNNVYESSPLERLLSSTEYGVGFETAGVNMEQQVNIANQVRRWEIFNGLPRSTAFYPAGSLSISISRDASQFMTRTFSDWLGRKVLTQVQTGPSTWEDTYYVYNDYNQLLFVIPPAAAGDLNPTQAVADLWHFRYEYDDFGRLVSSKAPGAHPVFTIYDRWDRPVLTQDGVQRARSPQEWSFVKYDVHNRPIITGTFAPGLTRAQLTTAVANSGTRDEIKNTSSVGYTLNRTYPTTVLETNLLTIEYFDDYHFLTITSWASIPLSNFAFGAEPGYAGSNITTVKGLLTGKRTRRIGDSDAWENTVFHYDKYYQPIQVISTHQMNGTVRTVTQYAFSGEVEKSVNIYTHNGATTRVQRRYTYDHAKRPTNLYHQVNTNTEVLLARTFYNELGQPYESIHHSRNNGTVWLYKNNSKTTTQGWLDEINYVFSNNAVVFNQKLNYNTSAGNGNTTRMDGLITSNRWQHHGSQPERSYTYAYSVPKRLTASTFRQRSGTTWTSNNFFNEDNIVYSNNGNITSLTRNSEVSGAVQQIDNLSYVYSGNRLMRVTDGAPTAHRPNGFNDGNTAIDDYVYNENGFVTIDRNKSITGITYNILDRPTRIDFASGTNIRYTYGAGGGLQTVARHVSGSSTVTLQYVGELVFENGTLTDINHEYGRVLANNAFRYQYYLTDYLGSTRVVLQEDPAVFSASAGLEAPDMAEESQQFIGYEEVVRISADMLNHTPGAESSYAMRLSGGFGENIGLAKSISVMPGDTVRMEVFGKYIDIGEAKRNPAVMAVLMAITAADPIGMGIDGALSTSANTLNAETGGLAGLLTSSKEIGDAPPAFLNYLFFDSEMNYKYGGFVQMSNAAREDGSNVPHEQLSRQVVAEEAGFFYIYLSNESSTGSEAFFDDFSVQVSESFIVQQIDYYPYGMVAREFRRLGDKATNDLFQGKTFEDLTRWYDFHARQYDAAVGRWFGVDPQDQFASPYVGMGNNPVMMVDPDGEFAFLAAALFAKKAIVALKAAKVAKVAVAATKTANASKLASVITKATSTKGLKTGLKSGAINMISNYDAKEGFGWNTFGDFAAGFAGGAFGFGAENKLIGMGVGGLMTWGVNGASFDYEGAQEFVGGALSSYVGMGKAVKGKHAVFKQIEGGNTLVKLNDGKFLSKTLMKHGDNFVSYGLQNNAYDFAYSKEEDFRSRGWGHLELFAWGGFSGAYQQIAFNKIDLFGASPLYQGIDWGINGMIKKRYRGIKTDYNKAIVSYLKWNFWLLSL